jgi:hypothetical protein
MFHLRNPGSDDDLGEGYYGRDGKLQKCWMIQNLQVYKLGEIAGVIRGVTFCSMMGRVFNQWLQPKCSAQVNSRPINFGNRFSVGATIQNK